MGHAGDDVETVDARGESKAELIAAQVREGIKDAKMRAERFVRPLGPDAGKMPALPTRREGWFPVIDAERCTQCKKCLAFCLFDVYGIADSGIAVERPSNCKPGCPACARVCPEAAIIFPKSPEEAINGGTVERTEANGKIDLSSLLGGDVYKRLRQRAFDPQRSPDEVRALRERQLALLAVERLLAAEQEKGGSK